jgi:ubiquinone/menaquinone biosynthesis C-methylase UbiE
MQTNLFIRKRGGRGFTPAFPLLALYDPVLRLLTRERGWRSALLARLAPAAGERIIDAGCGTGTLLAEIGGAAPGAQLIGLDPDRRILVRAEAKLKRARVVATMHQGYLRDLDRLVASESAAKIVSSLVFHQVSLDEKRDGLSAMFNALAPGGMLLVADYGLQRGVIMRTLFRLVQLTDGFADTQPNADGILPVLMQETGFTEVAEADVFATVTGSISIYSARKPTDR